MKLTPIADRIAKKFGDIRDQPEWEEMVFDEIQFANYGGLDFAQCDIVFKMVVARWNKAKENS